MDLETNYANVASVFEMSKANLCEVKMFTFNIINRKTLFV